MDRLRPQDLRALSKARKTLERCRRNIGQAEFALEQENLHHAAKDLRNLELSIGKKEEKIQKWHDQGK